MRAGSARCGEEAGRPVTVTGCGRQRPCATTTLAGGGAPSGFKKCVVIPLGKGEDSQGPECGQNFLSALNGRLLAVVARAVGWTRRGHQACSAALARTSSVSG